MTDMIFAKDETNDRTSDCNFAFEVKLDKTDLKEPNYRLLVQYPANAKLPFVRKELVVGD